MEPRHNIIVASDIVSHYYMTCTNQSNTRNQVQAMDVASDIVAVMGRLGLTDMDSKDGAAIATAAVEVTGSVW